MNTSRKYSLDQLKPIIEKSFCYRDVKRHLGLSPNGSNETFIRFVKEHRIDISHFTGQTWSKGKTREDHEAIARTTQKITKHTVEKSLQNGIRLSSKTLHRLLSQTGLEKRCNGCGNGTEWEGRPLALHIDHKNGNAYDNRAENLRYLCPNCHSQTETFGSKNRAQYESPIEIQCIWEKTTREISAETPRKRVAKPLKSCVGCGKETKNLKFCSYDCSHVASRKAHVSLDEIRQMLDETGFNYLAVGNKLGISDVAVRGRFRRAGETPPKSQGRSNPRLPPPAS